MIKKLILTVISIVLLISSAFAASKESSVKKGNHLYNKGDFESSLKNYEDALKADPESPEVNFNLGTALYKNKKYRDAASYLQKGLLSSDPDVKKNAHFNLGDALFAAGLTAEKQDVNEAIKNLEESARQFDTVVNLDDKDVDAKYNHDIVQKELERLRKKQEQQKQDQQRSQQNEDKKQDQKEQQGQQKQEQGINSSQSGSDSQNDQEQQQSSASEKKDDEKKPAFKPEDGSSQDKDNKKGEDGKEPQPQSGEMTKEEAKDLLKQFEQNEQPVGLLNFGKNKFQERPVLKDW
ncbi:MAG: tetratricopeptide repeat protein [Candidatus Omnitrophica bacterium]|nr:tetratricopeptide repeat protein [Candidatus Omnitrophota bacterium]